MKNEELKEGDVVEGRITGIQPYGIFIKLNDDCSGLVHATELEKLENDSKFFKVGQTLKVKILRIKPGGKQAVLRIHRMITSRKKMGAAQFETASGFTNLKKQLLVWVEEAQND